MRFEAYHQLLEEQKQDGEFGLPRRAFRKMVDKAFP